MKTNKKNSEKWKEIAFVVALVIASIAIVARRVESSNPAGTSETFTQLTFATPTEAGKALANAAKTGDQTELKQILGRETQALLTMGDPQADKAATGEFFTKFQRMNRWVEMTDDSRVLYIGADNFAFPVPLAKNAAGRWYFDAVAGAQEVRAREIGRNELLTIDACYALANAEEEYYDNSGVEYAQRVISTAGKQDGLYWPARDGQASSPLENLTEFPKSAFASYPPGEPLVIDGYIWRVLTAQGDDAPEGAKNYIVNGKMTDGFALLATPVKYGETGIMSFMISQEGIVYERDMGPDTAKLAAGLQTYNPDEYWWPAE